MLNMSQSDYTRLFISKPIALRLLYLLTYFTLRAYCLFYNLFCISRLVFNAYYPPIQPTSVTLPPDSPELYTLFTYTPVASLCTPPVSSRARSCCLAQSGAAILGVAKLLFRWCSPHMEIWSRSRSRSETPSSDYPLIEMETMRS